MLTVKKVVIVRDKVASENYQLQAVVVLRKNVKGTEFVKELTVNVPSKLGGDLLEQLYRNVESFVKEDE